jgi:hypothetical protein
MNHPFHESLYLDGRNLNDAAIGRFARWGTSSISTTADLYSHISSAMFSGTV